VGGGRKKLLTVARLFFIDRVKFDRPCRVCREYVFDEETGKPELRRGTSLPMLRPRGSSPPCHSCPKTIEEPPAGRSWTAAIDPPKWAYRAFRHWRQCAAVGFHVSDVEDRIVRRNAALFQSVADSVEAGHRGALFALLKVRPGGSG
jgi:hypothetical protein